MIHERQNPIKPASIVFFVLVAAVIVVSIAAYLKSTGTAFNITGLNSLFGSSGQESSQDAPQTSQTSQASSSKQNAAGFEIPLDYSEHPVICVSRGAIIRCTQDEISCIDGKGTVLWTIPVQMASPFLKVSEAGVLAADSGGRYLCFLNGGHKKWELNLQYPIVNADIADNGYVTVVQEVPGYKGRVTVFDASGVEIFNRSFAERYVLQAITSPQGRFMAVSSIDVSGIFSASDLEYIDMQGEPFAALTPGENEIYPYTFILSNEYVAAAGNKELVLYSDKRIEKWRKSFENIRNAAPAGGKYLVIASSQPGSRSGTSLAAFKTNGDRCYNIKLEGELAGLRTFGTATTVFGGRDVYFVSISGKITSKFASKATVKDVWFISRMEAVVVTQTSLIVVNIS